MIKFFSNHFLANGDVTNAILEFILMTKQLTFIRHQLWQNPLVTTKDG